MVIQFNLTLAESDLPYFQQLFVGSQKNNKYFVKMF